MNLDNVKGLHRKRSPKFTNNGCGVSPTAAITVLMYDMNIRGKYEYIFHFMRRTNSNIKP